MGNVGLSWEALANQVYPGLTASIKASGAGIFMDDEVKPKYSKHPDGSLATARFGLRYVYSDPKMLLRIVTVASRDVGGAWEREMYYYHCGPQPYDDGATHFRVDLHVPHGLHAHLPPDVKKHLARAVVQPDIASVSALDFVQMVKRFRVTGVAPISLKGGK